MPEPSDCTPFPKAIQAPRAACRLPVLMVTACALIAAVAPAAVQAGKLDMKPPEILFIGDSHLSFGAGKIFREFFRDFEKQCTPYERWKGQARAVAMRRFGLMGVKSTSPHNWVHKKRSLKKMVCEPDPKWPVNARLYGFKHRTDGTYVQLGRDQSFPFCKPGKTALEAVFEWTKPRLLVLYFMGNTIGRWANSPKSARSDVMRLMAQIPKTTGCMFMTTSPVYLKKHNKRRVKAQANIAEAFAKLGGRCQFVPMLTPATIAAIEGRAGYFRRHKDGRVKDPYHPGLTAARHLLRIQRGPICKGVLNAVRPDLIATVH
ncbi:MAG: hypothetical protein JXQ99_07310 [Hyphomicrobiaceae bacterium]